MPNNAILPDVESLIRAGIDPKTGLPKKAGGFMLKDNIKKVIRVIDETDAINRYKWEGLPPEIPENLLERVLYYRGQGAFLFDQYTEKYFFLPYKLSGENDVYGRYMGIQPLPFNGTSDGKSDAQPYITSIRRTPVYDKSVEPDKMTQCVLFYDYSKQISQTVLSRKELNEGIIDVEADCIPFMRTALKNATGVTGIRTGGEDESSKVLAANIITEAAAQMGDKYVPIDGTIDFQELATGGTGRADDYLQAMQALDNFRLGAMGLDNGGLFQKKAHILKSEQILNEGGPGLVLYDGLRRREEQAELVNYVFGLSCSVTINKQATENISVVDELDESESMDYEAEEVIE